MQVTLLAFGITRDILGTREVAYQLPEPPTVANLLLSLQAAYPEMSDLASLKVAVNNEYASPETVIQETDEVVLIPPVSGG